MHRNADVEPLQRSALRDALPAQARAPGGLAVDAVLLVAEHEGAARVGGSLAEQQSGRCSEQAGTMIRRIREAADETAPAQSEPGRRKARGAAGETHW